MRKNEYNSLEDFINEYNGKYEIGDEFHIGIEFTYKGVLYRMCREPGQEKYFLYQVIKFPKRDDYKDVLEALHNFEYKWLGIYDTIELLLDSEAIDNRKFKDVIMDDDTIIESKD